MTVNVVPHHDRPCTHTVYVRHIDAPAGGDRTELQRWPRHKLDIRTMSVTATVDGSTIPIRTRHQLETLERAQGDVTVTAGADAAPVKSAMTRTSRRISGTARPRFDVLGSSADADAVRWISEQVRQRGGRVLVVGGAVRDALRNTYGHGLHDPKDLDIEVYGVQPDQLAALLSRRWTVDETGKSFAVLKLAGLDVDVSLPRRETRTGTGHRAFDVTPDPWMTPETAATRRDFTINAIGFDVATSTIIDPTGGAADLAARKLRVVSDAFDEDPLRVLRGAQFVARFDLTATADTIARCRNLRGQADTLPRERIWDECTKLLTKAARPGAGVAFLEDAGWLDLWPELHGLGAAHVAATASALDRWAATRPPDRDDAVVTGLAVLTHRIGTGTHMPDPHAAGQHAAAMVRRLCPLVDMPADVATLIDNFGSATQAGPRSDADIRHLANQVGRIDLLANVAAAAGHGDVAHTIYEHAARLGVATCRPVPLLRGQDLIDAGVKPGRHIGQMLRDVYITQLDGAVTTTEQALAAALSHVTGDRTASR
jgi:tRNA nucleotidyltransferase (CCA-adding enzyme)